MFAEGDSELRDLIVQNLQSSGFLNKIKAEIRAGVFLALSEDNTFKNVPLPNKKLKDFVDTNNGKLALAMVREFLEYFNLNITLSVFDPEISCSDPCMNRKSLCDELNLNESDFEGPVISTLLSMKNEREKSDILNEERLKMYNDSVNKISVNNCSKQKGILSEIPRDRELKNDLFDDKRKNLSETVKNEESVDIPLFSTNKSSGNKEFFHFEKPEDKDIFKSSSSVLDPFFDEPVPTVNPSFFTLTESNDRKNVSSISLSSDKGSLSSLRDLPSLTKPDKNKINEINEDLFKPDILSGNVHTAENYIGDFGKKDVDPESNEESSERQINSEESIEEEIEEDISAGLDDLLNSSLSLGDDATSDQTVSQTSVVDGVDHIETCNSVA